MPPKVTIIFKCWCEKDVTNDSKKIHELIVRQYKHLKEVDFPLEHTNWKEEKITQLIDKYFLIGTTWNPDIAKLVTRRDEALFYISIVCVLWSIMTYHLQLKECDRNYIFSIDEDS